MNFCHSRPFTILCASPGKSRQQCRHLRGFSEKFKKQLLFGSRVKVLERIAYRCLLGAFRAAGRNSYFWFNSIAAPIKLFLESHRVYSAVIVQNMGISLR